jgi:hypothetical protein
MEQVVILLLIALISLINWLVKKSSELRKARKLKEGTAEGLRGAPSAPDTQSEVNMRRFREALGLPEEALPPAVPKRVEKQVPPPLPPSRPKKTPPATPAPSVPVAPAHLAPAHVARAHVAPADERFRSVELHHRVGKRIEHITDVAAKRSRIQELLGSRGGLRDAVVLSEILSSPKALRKGDPELLK